MAGDELKIHSWQGTKKTFQALIHPLVLSQDERRQMIADAAYYRAERRGFAPGSEVEDWLAAEKEVMERLKAMAECAPKTQPSATARSAAPKGSVPAAESHTPAAKAARKKPARRRTKE